MPINPSQLPALAWFVHIARHLSFTKAATEMEISRAALSQHLRSLEEELDVRLLHRTTRTMSLTEEGQRLFDGLAPALKAIDAAVGEIGESRSAPSGLIRVNTSRIAARTLLEPHLAEFFARYPELRIEMILNDGFSNIVADSTDVGIRLGESLDEHMVAVPITPPIEMAIVGSPEYFERNGIPESPAELTQHNCLAYRFAGSGTLDRWTFSDEEGHTQTFEPRGSAVFNDDDSMLRAALNGVGIIKYLDLCIYQQIKSGELVRVLKPWCRPFPGFYLYAPTRAQMPSRVRVLIDFLVEKRALFR
ncbi:LysR family transcriptional regulator [Spongiibacter taiwanensis]|uniref:LysR family transcriptional regulator n=1 Tax=Spongiibacter taiwanensis TaxID=1748242 RepID=UPI00203664DC|nr:LysR family transcriptional regulator [Spongiibacter taiwanensis]USA43857.1 LysR family transcriptional regulator [Spongiibacter taiwanensis]